MFKFFRSHLALAAILLLSPLAMTSANTAYAAAPPAAAAAGDKIDINSATADQLKAIPGIGDAYAKRIIDGRPYVAKNQLTSRGILPQKTYDAIKDKIIAHAPAKK
jgi:competence protein ComEA